MQTNRPEKRASNSQTPAPEMDELLVQIERGEIPLQLIVGKLVELLVKLDAKERQLDNLIQQIPMLSDITKKISEIHTLHFPTKELKKKSQKERFMAQILLGPVKKRKVSAVRNNRL